MGKYLKLRRVASKPERHIALEYESVQYQSWARVRDIPNVSWQSEPMDTDDLVSMLRGRGWHPTDIGDELNEARLYTGPEA